MKFLRKKKGEGMLMRFRGKQVLSFAMSILLLINAVHLPAYADNEDFKTATCSNCKETLNEETHIYCSICETCNCIVDHEATPSTPPQNDLVEGTCKICEGELCSWEDETPDTDIIDMELEDNKQNEFDVDAIWERYDDYEDICMIGKLDQEKEEYRFFGDSAGYVHTASNALCPDYLILYERFMENGSDIFYRVDSLDLNFADEVTSIYSCLEADMLSDVFEIDDAWITLNNEGTIDLYKEPSTSSESESVNAADLASGYPAEEIFYDYESGWFIKLLLDEEWTAEKENVWVHGSCVQKIDRIDDQNKDENNTETNTDPLSVWDTIVSYNETLKIGFFDKADGGGLTFISGEEGEDYLNVNALDCPDYVIVEEEYIDDDGNPVIYKVNAFDEDFRENILPSFSYVAEHYFTEVVEIEELMADLINEGLIAVSKTPEIQYATDALYYDAEKFIGTYDIQEFEYDPDNPDDWFFKLKPDETWPSEAEGYNWVGAKYVENLVIKTSEGSDNEELFYTEAQASADGTTVTVCGNMPEDTTVSIESIDIDTNTGSNGPVIYGAFDIKLLDKNGNEWQPLNGKSLSVTLSVANMNIDDGTSVRILHEHSAVIDDLGIYEVDNGLVSFTVTGFSIITIQSISQNRADINGTVYLDLNAGNVTLDSNGNYTGYRFDGRADGPNEYTGKITANQQFYIYQSFGDKYYNTGLVTVDGEEVLVLPDYSNNRIPDWTEIIKDNPVVDDVIVKWDELAVENSENLEGWAPRTATPYSIKISPSSSLNSISMTLDNIWSKYYVSGLTTTSRSTGAITCHWAGTAENVSLYFKGDNRMNNIHYYTTNSKSALSISGDPDATLTVCNLSKEAGYNFWCSAIGGSDGYDSIYGLSIHGGNIYAGTTIRDDSTAIGGGGNGFGGITINGDAVVTAVSNSSGAAIGGGIGKTSNGGKANILITGDSEVYAYNYSSGWTNGVIPAVAIGGGSSYALDCGESTIKISGNSKVFAQTIGGTAIGGGSSSSKNGGTSTVEISEDAIVTAVSISDYVSYYKDTGRKNLVKTKDKYPAGASIGGGTGGTSGNGGDCTLKVLKGEGLKENYPVINTGSIGGGKTLSTSSSYHIGKANVVIEAGTVQGQVVMAAGAGESEDRKCSFTMKGGTIDNTSAKTGTLKQINTNLILEFDKIINNKNLTFTFLEENGGAVNVANGTANVQGGTIKNTKANNGGAIYVDGGDFVMNGDGRIDSSIATENGGAVCIDNGSATIYSGEISETSANNGGGVAVIGGTFTMDGQTAKIEKVNAANNGGAVYVETGEVYMKNGEIYDVSASNGGAVSILGGTYTMTGGTISKFRAVPVNKTGGLGGAIYVTDGTATVSETADGTGLIRGTSEETEALRGGAVYIGGGTFRMDGGSIENCDATEMGGGVYLDEGEFSSLGGMLKQCSALLDGGGAYLSNGEFMMNGGSVLSCTSSRNGGGVYLGGGTLSMEGGSIENCEAENGGAMYIAGGASNMNGGSLKRNTAQKDGGAVYVTNTSAEFGGVTSGIIISENAAGENGGGLFIEQNEELEGNDGAFVITITTGTLSDNTAGAGGGGIYQTGSHGLCIVKGTSKISGNTAQNGGGIFVTNGSSLNVTGGMISNNQAVSNESLPTTAYYDDQNVGVGGGVYIGPGTSGFTTAFTLSGDSVGIYGNEADLAADDVYSNKANTRMSLPNVLGMNMIGYDGIATGWFEDYADLDTMYSEGLKNASEGSRYRGASYTYEATVGNTTKSNVYICLTIGKEVISFGTLEIKRTGAEEECDQVFVYRIESLELENPHIDDFMLEVSITGDGSAKILKVPYGNYRITELESWSWRYTPEAIVKDITVDKINENPTVLFENLNTDDHWTSGNSQKRINVFPKRNFLSFLFSEKGKD